MKTLQKEKLNIFNFLALTVAGIVNATGITFFLQPMHLYDSGISGTSMFLSMVTPLPLSIFLLIFNIPLFLYGLKRQGKVFTIYAIYTVAIYSVTAWLITDILPIDPTCDCPVCRNFSRAYVRHLLKAKEVLGLRLAVMHNLYFYNSLMEKIREALDNGTFGEFYNKYVNILDKRAPLN